MPTQDKIKSAATKALNTKIKNVGAGAAQLSSKLSFNEKTQINAIKDLGSPSTTAGKLQSDSTAALNKLSRTQNSAMNIGADIAGKLESQGVFNKNTKALLNGSLQSSVQNKIPLTQEFPKLPVDLSNWNNRIPSNFKTPQEKMKNAKEALTGISDFRYNGVIYPADLVQEAAAYVKLQFFTYTRGDPFAAGSVNPAEFISLPLPDNLSFAFNVKYQERDTGIMGDVMNSSVAQAAINESANKKGAERMKSAGSALINSLSELTGDDATSAAGQVAMRAGFAALESANDIAGGLAGQIVGSIPNPHPTVFFKGMELRQFQWSWKFVPRSEQEANDLTQALTMIKRFILPEKENNFLKYPKMVQPIIEGDNVAMYGTFKKALVSAFSVNYTGEGQSAFFVDGQPVSILCNMTFQEVENYTSGDA